MDTYSESKQTDLIGAGIILNVNSMARQCKSRENVSEEDVSQVFSIYFYCLVNVFFL